MADQDSGSNPDFAVVAKTASSTSLRSVGSSPLGKIRSPVRVSS